MTSFFLIDPFHKNSSTITLRLLHLLFPQNVYLSYLKPLIDLHFSPYTSNSPSSRYTNDTDVSFDHLSYLVSLSFFNNLKVSPVHPNLHGLLRVHPCKPYVNFYTRVPLSKPSRTAKCLSPTVYVYRVYKGNPLVSHTLLPRLWAKRPLPL